MKVVYGNTDKLTDLQNENYLDNEYHKYIKKYPKSYLIMMDLKNFKYINDNFGHDMGDKFLVLFAKIIKTNFENSLVIRLHGDEFAILTGNSLEKIDDMFIICKQQIDSIMKSGILPERIIYNAGIVRADSNMEETKQKADYMMYYAKRNNKDIQIYDEEIWLKKENEEIFLKKVMTDINNDALSYFKRDIYNMNDEVKIHEIITKDSNEDCILDDDNYKSLRRNLKLKHIDMHNIELVFSKMKEIGNGEVLINIDYRSLITEKNLLDFFKILLYLYHVNANRIILNININSIIEDNHLEIINMFKELKFIGFKICIDKYNNITPDIVFENVDIDYIKVDKKYWKNSINNMKSQNMLLSKLRVFNDCENIIPIFTSIDNKEEKNYISKICASMIKQENILLAGNFISKETKIKIK
ncbi:MAG TPA: GGDEF domain-containing protein [Bacilli bacterium]|nr:GGDEF domain-containing protein [Bacilli bacterium]